jgi:AcrR family transcriptional regulator
MALLRTPRSRWIDEGLRALAQGGPDAVRVEVLAEALGVTKGGFYGQFDDRGDLLDAMLDVWERTVIDRPIEIVEGDGGDARAKLWHLFTLVSSPDVTPRQALKVELAVRDWARRDPAVAARLRRVDERRAEYLRSLFGAFCTGPEDVEARCLLVFSLFVGQHFVAVEHGDLSRSQVLEAAARLILS